MIEQVVCHLLHGKWIYHLGMSGMSDTGGLQRWMLVFLLVSLQASLSQGKHVCCQCKTLKFNKISSPPRKNTHTHKTEKRGPDDISGFGRVQAPRRGSLQTLAGLTLRPPRCSHRRCPSPARRWRRRLREGDWRIGPRTCCPRFHRFPWQVKRLTMTPALSCVEENGHGRRRFVSVTWNTVLGTQGASGGSKVDWV